MNAAQPMTELFKRECDDADALLRFIGLNPEQCRTDGGALNLARVKTFLAERAAASGPVAWWNGIRKADIHDCTVPSFSEHEDTWHDIPVYDGVNPCNLPPAASEPVATRVLIEECRDALAEELKGWDIDPPLHHVKQAHDRCVDWLAATQSAASESRVLGAGLDPRPNPSDPVVVDAFRAPDDARAALLELWSTHIDASVRAELMGALVMYLDAVNEPDESNRGWAPKGRPSVDLPGSS